jgi:hypothetical protein
MCFLSGAGAAGPLAAAGAAGLAEAPDAAGLAEEPAGAAADAPWLGAAAVCLLAGAGEGGAAALPQAASSSVRPRATGKDFMPAFYACPVLRCRQILSEQETSFMAKIRHIAIRSEDVEATARMFVEVFGLELVQRRGHGPIDLSDGDVNITVLPMHVGAADREVRPGYEHIGFTVEDQDDTRKRLLEFGAKELNPVALGDAYYESKYKSSEGLVIDVGHWRGTSPIDGKEPAATAANS